MQAASFFYSYDVNNTKCMRKQHQIMQENSGILI